MVFLVETGESETRPSHKILNLLTGRKALAVLVVGERSNR